MKEANKSERKHRKTNDVNPTRLKDREGVKVDCVLTLEKDNSGACYVAEIESSEHLWAVAVHLLSGLRPLIVRPTSERDDS